MFSVEHASSKGPAVTEEGRGGGEEEEQQASCLVAKQAVEFPQVLASWYDQLLCSCQKHNHLFPHNLGNMEKGTAREWEHRIID